VKVISFAWTTPALVAGRKTVTRREWSDAYAARFHEGDLIQAWNRQPRFKGAQRVATIRLTADPYPERLCDIPDEDWEGEGFAYLTDIGATVQKITPIELWAHWKVTDDRLYVVRFELVEVLA
jgi:uncharacterized protein YqfB (UPF0267 family)